MTNVVISLAQAELLIETHKEKIRVLEQQMEGADKGGRNYVELLDAQLQFHYSEITKLIELKSSLTKKDSIQ